MEEADPYSSIISATSNVSIYELSDDDEEKEYLPDEHYHEESLNLNDKSEESDSEATYITENVRVIRKGNRFIESQGCPFDACPQASKRWKSGATIKKHLELYHRDVLASLPRIFCKALQLGICPNCKSMQSLHRLHFCEATDTHSYGELPVRRQNNDVTKFRYIL